MQQKIIDSKARYKIVVCGRRSGKTTMAINELLMDALTTKGGLWWYVAPTYTQAKMIAWQMLMKQVRDLPRELVHKINESDLYVVIGNGSRIEIKGSDNEDSLRGTALDGIVLDEYADIKPRVFESVVRPMLADRKGWATFIGTPKGFNHFYHLYKKGQNEEEVNYESFSFPTVANPYIDPDEVKEAGREMDEDLFAQEFLGEFRKFSGLVYKEFDRHLHVWEDYQPEPGAQIWRAMDFGARNPTVCLWISVDNDGQIIVFDEYFETEKTLEYHTGIIVNRHTELVVQNTFGDPSGAQEMLDYAQHGLYITPALRDVAKGESWVASGIHKIQGLLKKDPGWHNLPKLYITKNCKNLINEFEHYHWAELPKREDVPLKDQPVKVDDHGLDALRCFVVSYHATMNTTKRRQTIQIERSSVTGY